MPCIRAARCHCSQASLLLQRGEHKGLVGIMFINRKRWVLTLHEIMVGDQQEGKLY